ncbi:hypothetical protein ABZV75_29530 [Streptomyces flaveolus]|uniref:hypothetical protein n=1 Tax=Streptomyces flaveolus TaxID=67297 RepID=UPI0033A0B9A3
MRDKARIDRAGPRTRPAVYDIEERLPPPPEVRACFPDVRARAVAELGGPGWRGEHDWAFWPVHFSHGADRNRPAPCPWRAGTSTATVSGTRSTHSRQRLLPIGLYSDVAPTGGGTLAAAGSHRRTAHVLAHPFLFQTGTCKHTGPPRFTSNTAAGLTASLRLRGDDRTGAPLWRRPPRQCDGFRTSTRAGTP